MVVVQSAVEVQEAHFTWIWGERRRELMFEMLSDE